MREGWIDTWNMEIYLYEGDILFYIFSAETPHALVDLKLRWESRDFNPTCASSKLDIMR